MPTGTQNGTGYRSSPSLYYSQDLDRKFVSPLKSNTTPLVVRMKFLRVRPYNLTLRPNLFLSGVTSSCLRGTLILEPDESGRRASYLEFTHSGRVRDTLFSAGGSVRP